MPGFSITLFLLPGASDSSAPDTSLLLSLLDDPAAAPGWKWNSNAVPSAEPITPASKADAGALASSAHKLKAADPKGFIEAIHRACKALNEEEPEITRMDNIAGDGDCGLTLRDGANGELASATVDPGTPSARVAHQVKMLTRLYLV